MEPHSYVWLLIIGGIVAFAAGFGIGANDVANSFSSSVGSRTLTLKQACTIAIFTEFFGAFLLGANTSETIRGGIIKISLFQDNPDLLMLAMVCALIGSATWVIFASFRGWPVSTTHSAVGAIVGVGISAYGWKAVDWSFNGVTKIIVSWFIAPIVAGVVVSIIFLTAKYLILIHQDSSFRRALIAVPIYITFTIAINIFYLIFKGEPSLKLDNLHPNVIALIIVGVTIFVSVFSYFFYAQFLRRKIIGKETGLEWYHVFVVPFIGPRYDNTDNDTEIGTNDDQNGKQEGIETEENVNNSPKNIFQAAFTAIGNYVARGISKEVADYKAHDNIEMHDAAAKYDPNTEQLYSFLQILTASLASFSHGSNDVSNAIGPLITIFLIYDSGIVEPSGTTSVPLWILALGGFAIDVGLVLYGYHVMRSLGNQITYNSPSRGFAIELGTSLTVLSASKIGLPISTTHCVTIATAAIGLCNGNVKALNWKLLASCFFSWALTVPVSALIAGGIYAFTAYAPSAPA
ncbi:18215_t:CDS:2 [Funneliformis geosporum]|uniref:Phosphate transporter n=1 Tax=Funneliformis geosporum TaxID=1117311 RepID=A0A9W4WQF6_9GLOM|nr:11371_t:CDS:2 [Funneliformis geosporum]CAI2173508.1 18215_t:CDS:2 [Funneliformis geosporum]